MIYQSYLDSFQNFGVRLGLERMADLMAGLGNPQDQIPSIHIAGTNGKGSTCAFVSAILQAAGYRVGRYTSPHLVDWRERITIDGRPIPAAAFNQLLGSIQPEVGVTQFEVVTAAAFYYFALQKVDIMVIEVGLGGRLDATNILKLPLVTAITSIGFDHCHILGNTLGKIAAEKAGIFKTGVPIITAQLPTEAREVIQSLAAAKKCPLTVIAPAAISDHYFETQGITYQPSLGGLIQAQNSAVAIGICQELVTQGWSISPTAITKGLASARWPGRYQKLTCQGKALLIDGAHNDEGAAALRRYVDRWQLPISWVLGLLRTKESGPILTQLLRPGDELFTVPVRSGPARDPLELCLEAQSIQPQLSIAKACANVPEALTQATQALVLCGSLYLIGDFLADQGYTAETVLE
jgi:dihydrofolate synthase/folylpolyglutamate synthase